jgi:hypothetical protein
MSLDLPAVFLLAPKLILLIVPKLILLIAPKLLILGQDRKSENTTRSSRDSDLPIREREKRPLIGPKLLIPSWDLITTSRDLPKNRVLHTKNSKQNYITNLILSNLGNIIHLSSNLLC